ncbi:hypothetical protein EE612_056803 [Oryza sativa]|nr:hypothetical protein EE612_056803 [Oryza sativa]
MFAKRSSNLVLCLLHHSRVPNELSHNPFQRRRRCLAAPIEQVLMLTPIVVLMLSVDSGKSPFLWILRSTSTKSKSSWSSEEDLFSWCSLIMMSKNSYTSS